MKKWILIILGLVGLDQLTKYLVVTSFAYEGQSLVVIKNFFQIRYVMNSNMVFGLKFLDSTKHYWVFVIFIVIAVAIFGSMLVKTDFKDKKLFWYHLSLALLISGALGNGLDRIFQDQHAVVDFIDFYGIWQYVFNIADICLNVGIAIFLFDQFILEPRRKKING
jgi:signal peptidase II